MSSARPLCVDLDGTLIRSDSLFESMALLMQKKPLVALQLPLWVLRGKSFCKAQVAKHVIPDASLLPYRQDLLEFLHQEKQAGRTLVLASAADERIVKAVAEHTDLFDAYHGSTVDHNLRSANKATLLKERYQAYDYIGDSKHDVAVWKDAQDKYLAGDQTHLAQGFEFKQTFTNAPDNIIKAIIKLIRPHQWLKNMLIFLPMLLAFRIGEPELWTQAVICFFCFSFMASLVYVLNDSLDIENDRRHPKKHKRPIAAARISLPTAGMVAIGLACASLLPAVILMDSLTLLYMLLGYFVLTSLYTFSLKKIIILDVLILAGLFTYRIITGGVVVDIPLTPWLLAFSMFLFSSLAMAKRWIDLMDLQSSGKTVSSGRGYQVDDRSVLLHMGSAAAMCTVMVFSLFINDKCNEKPLVYLYPEFLWLLCPLLMYWLMRVWFLASRGHVHEDPVLFAAKDKVTYLVLIASVVLVIFAKGDLL